MGVNVRCSRDRRANTVKEFVLPKYKGQVLQEAWP